MKQKFLFFIFSIFIFIGLAAGSLALADTCPTDNGAGVGCLDPSFPYYCGGACRGSQTQCPTWAPSPVCASGFSCTNFAAADACGYGATCSTGYTRCGSWPNYTCTSTIAPVAPCSTYDTCNNYCTACTSGYSLCSSNHSCVATQSCQPGQTFNACTAACEGSISMLKLGYDSVFGSSVIQSATYPTLYIPSSGYVGIGTTMPSAKLEVSPASGYSILAGTSTASTFKIGNVASPTADTDVATLGWVNSALSSYIGGSYMPLSGGTMTGALNMGNFQITNLASPTLDTDAATRGWVNSVLSSGSYLPLSGGTMTGDINLGNFQITNVGTLVVDKLTAVTIDPLYSIRGINYSTFASSIAGGVKEEYIGRVKINKWNRTLGEYETAVNFNNVEEGSELWVWRQVVDFNENNIDVLITPYGSFAQVYYLIDGNKLVFRSDRPATISYRLIGKRFDWREWPLKAADQTTVGFHVPQN